MAASAEPCPECGVERGKELTLEEYEQLWADSPHLYLALSRNVQVECQKCGRILTWDRNPSPGPKTRRSRSRRLGPNRTHNMGPPTG